MPKFRLHGIDTIKIGDCGADGAMGASLTAINALIKESVVFSIDEPEIARLLVENTDEPDIIAITKAGMKKVTFSTRDFDVDTLAIFFGGSASGEVFSATVNSNTKIWQSVEITGQYVDGYKTVIDIPRALVYAKMNAPFTNAESGIIEVTCEVAVPVNGSGVAQAPYTLENVAEAT
jgi:hypothetical protein